MFFPALLLFLYCYRTGNSYSITEFFVICGNWLQIFLFVLRLVTNLSIRAMIVAMKKYMNYCITTLLSLSLIPAQAFCADLDTEGDHGNPDSTIPVMASPLDTAHAILAQIQDAVQTAENAQWQQETQFAEETEMEQDPRIAEETQKRQEAQMAQLWALMEAQQNALGRIHLNSPMSLIPSAQEGNGNGLSPFFQDSLMVVSETEAETEAETEFPSAPETESELPQETETEFQPEPAGAAIPDTGDPVAADRWLNEARISIYDYRMLREYPLSRLPKDMHTLSRLLTEQVAAYDGTWSVYVQNLNTGQELVVNDQPMRSASVMKLFIMETVYEAFKHGDLPRNEDTVYLLRSMIINSSNESSNRLLTLLGDGDIAAGIARVNELIRLRGFSEGTHEYNGFEDPNASLDPSHPNQVVAKDVGLLLSRIYHRTFLSRRVCNEIEQMMLDQGTRYKIPRGLPEGEGAQCGNKSGETDTIANDAAVVYGPTTDYILVVLSNDWSSEDTANAQIAEVSRTVYNFFEH